jgi:NADH:ubiquinone oxidoreductase subunit 2 (subunit N)
VIAVLNSAISLGYYLRVPATMYFHPPRESAQPTGNASFFEGLVLAGCAAAVLLLGLLPQDALPGVSSLLQMADVNVLQLASDAAASFAP